jgi:hypothetical protein
VIFISYSWRDRDYALDLCWLLQSAGQSCWVDSDCLDVGSPLRPQLCTAVSRASAIVLIDSPASRASPWVQFEQAVARALGKPVLSARTKSRGSLIPEYGRQPVAGVARRQ